MHAPAPTLSLPVRSTIVLIALLQGLALYAAQRLSDTPPFTNGLFSYGFHAWLLVIPSAVALTLVDLRDRRMWAHLAGASLLVLALAVWIGWNLQGAEGLSPAPLRAPFAVGLAIAAFIALPWWQFRLAQGHWRADYSALFERAWQNGLTLALAAAFTGLAWLLLWLCSALFKLVQVGFFAQLFRQESFIALFTGTVIGFGLLLGRTQHRAMQITRQVLFAVCRALLPLLSLIAVLFVLALPFTGLEPLWNTRSAAQVLLTLLLLLVLFVNAVYQHDDQRPAYPRALRLLVQASLVALPVYGGLAVYALGLRIGQYGWSVERFWGMVVAVLAAGYALGYALAALPHGGRWLQRLEPVNRVMCWVVLAAAVLCNSPLIDPVRITLASQLPRLSAAPAQISSGDARMLRFDLGRRGVTALRTLQAAPAVAADPRASALLRAALASSNRYAMTNDGAERVQDAPALQARIRVASGHPAPEADWWQALADGALPVYPCADAEDRCVALRQDLDGDGRDDMLMCNTGSTLWVMCALQVRTATGWARAGTVTFQGSRDNDQSAIADALASGALQLRTPRWPELEAGGVRAVIEQDRSFTDDAPAPSPQVTP